MRKRSVPMLRRFLGVIALFLAFSSYAGAQSPALVQERLRTGINLYGQGKWREAVLELRRVQAEAPTKELRGEALFWISISQLSAGEYEAALRDMDALEKTDPGNLRLKELPYHRGRALYYLGRFDEAIVVLKKYSDSITPGGRGVLSAEDSNRKSSALYWTGECLFSMGLLYRAGDIFRIITEEYPLSPKYEASVYKLALIEQKRVELELLGLLRWSHEESLRNMEEFRRKESSYDQALNAYQRRIASLENTLRETSASLERLQANNASGEEPW